MVMPTATMALNDRPKHQGGQIGPAEEVGRGEVEEDRHQQDDQEDAQLALLEQAASRN